MISTTLLLGDALRHMADLPAGSVDLIVTDPPYGQTRNAWDKVIPFDDMWPAIWRVCRGPVIFTAMQPFSSALVMSQHRRFRHEWIWRKNKSSGHLNAKKAPMRAHEQVLVFSKGSTGYKPQMTDGHKPGNFARRTGFSANYGEQTPTEYGGSTLRYPTSVQDFDIVNNDDPNKIHPTQKPVDLIRYLIETYSNEGDTVLDFCMGSGTTGLACQQTNRNFLGIELLETYFDIAQRRLGLSVLATDTDIFG